MSMAWADDDSRWDDVPLEHRPHYVYRIYDVDGVLLYIGCAYDVEQRLYMHKAATTLPCWADIRHRYGRHTSQRFPTLAAARAAERAAITAEAPKHNRQHNPKRWRRVHGQWVPAPSLIRTP